ncbi:RNA polymerase subunit sigma-24 [Amycolatopsis balhimycina DSM 5908]|uniref:RNA polymerase subunit sigma-24 n=1 Tax=Amycolatopsis balhimycina DSM 5908 TaxID=1081091 RepID=A0A428WUK7_AMYBA|nr:RNA polymerase subunit sigma-24 [Amycolatopsis balhimycina DSM 5908]
MTGGRATPLPSDTELLERLRSGDESAYALLLDAWSGKLMRVARYFVTTNDSARELVQETWLAVLRGITGFEGRSSLKTWVFRILVNAAKRRSAQESRTIPWSSVVQAEDAGPTIDPSRFRGPGDPYPGDWWAYPAAWPTPEQEAMAAEIRNQVASALTELPERQQIVLTLRDVEGHTSEEVCAILEISAANQRVLLHRARAAVRKRLEDYFAAASPAEDPDAVAP